MNSHTDSKKIKRRNAAKKGIRKLGQHIVLAVGSFVFAIPFIWLISTSCKSPDEMYPPKWVPGIPRGIVESPYIQIRENERATRPIGVVEEDWERLSEPVMAAVSVRVGELADQVPEFYRQYLAEPDVAQGVFSRILKRAPDHLFEKNETVVAGWFCQNVTAETVQDVFDAVYRRVALSEVAIHGWDVSAEYPTVNGNFAWEVVEGDAEVTRRAEGLRRVADEVSYSLGDKDSFALRTVIPMEMAPENVKKVVISNHADKSWHRIGGGIEMAGRRYEAVQPAFLGSDRWQDLTWQMASEDDHSIKMKNWLRMEDAGASDFNEPGKMRVTVRYEKATRPVAAWNKYTNNYREVLRIAPLSMYVKNSVLLVLLNIVGQVVGSSLVAYSFARLRWPGREFCFVLVLATLMIPPQVTMIPVFLIFKNLGWYNTLKPLWVGSFFGSAFYIFLLRQFMRGIPVDLEDSAKIDGCGYLGIYARVIMPLVKPALATIGIFTFMGVWNEFMGPLIYLNDQRLYPLSLGLFALKVFRIGEFGLMMAAAVLMTAPVIALFFLAQRQFIQGITLTGLKG